MNNITNELTEVRSLISRNHIKDALELCLSILDKLESRHTKTKFQHRITVYQLQERTLRDRENAMTADSDDRIEKNKLAYSILATLDDITNEYGLEKENLESKSITIKADNEKVLNELAQELAFNYFNVTFTERYNDSDNEMVYIDIDETSKKVFKKEAVKFFKEGNRGVDKCRNILVVGAGATYDAFNIFPFGEEMKQELKNSLHVDRLRKDKNGNPDKIFNDRFNKAEHLEVEPYLSFLTGIFGADAISKELNEYYNFRHMPCLMYEIIAHLLKHGFIDVVINFNFDELLDQTVEEEIGLGNFHKIISDGDCVELSEILVDGSIKTPIYIKVHGTASNKSTMNINDKQNFEIHKDIQALIGEIISGQRSSEITKNAKRTTKIPIVNIICVGFSMQNKEFNNILKKLPAMSKIFHLNIDSMPDSGSEQVNNFTNGDTYKRFFDVSKIKPDSDLAPLDIIFQGLWKKVSDLFEFSFRPRQIDRHEIITKIFYGYSKLERNLELSKGDKKKTRERLKEYYHSIDYYFDRVVIELGMLIAKNKGILDFQELIPDRLGYYYHLYRQDAERKNVDFMNLPQIAREVFKMKEEYDCSGNLFVFPPITEDDLTDTSVRYLKLIMDEIDMRFKSAIIRRLNEDKSKAIFFRYLKNLPKDNGRMKEYLNSAFRNSNNTRLQEVTQKSRYILTRLKYLHDNFVYDINARFNDNRMYRFASFNRDKILHTNLGLSYEILLRFIESDSWNILFMVSERGKTLKKALKILEDEGKLEKLKHKKIIIICAYEVLLEELNDNKTDNLEKRYKEKFCDVEDSSDFREIIDNMKIHVIPYREHSNHMALFINTNVRKIKNNNNIILNIENDLSLSIECTYYYKKGISNKINPFIIEGISFKSERYLKFASKDVESLLKIFYKYYLIARVFETNNYEALGYIKKEPKFMLKTSHSNKTEFTLRKFIEYIRDGRMKDLYKGDFSLV
jgi:hypothetical protein